MATKKKTFDAIAASRRWRRETSRLVRNMTQEERLAFFNRRLDHGPGGSQPKGPRVLAHR